MRVGQSSSLALASLLMLCGCAEYEYRLIQPSQFAQLIGEHPVTVVYDPLEYQFRRYDDHIDVAIVNPTENSISMLGNRSYVVDPGGESHPVRSRMIAPHSHSRMLLPPKPVTFVGYSYAPYGPWPWWYPYSYGPYWYYPVGPYYWPYSYSYNITTAFDWQWKLGEARLSLTYQDAGKTFEHQFIFSRHEVKK